MTDTFHIPSCLPQDWFVKTDGVWYAKTHLGNTIGTKFIDRLSYSRKQRKNIPVFRKSDIYLVNIKDNTFIPVSGYDEHEDGKPLLKYVYKQFGLKPSNYTVFRPTGLNITITPDDNAKLYNLLCKLKKTGYDISKTNVYIGYLGNNSETKISAEEFLSGDYNQDVVSIPMTKLGEDIKQCFEDFRDIFSKQICGKYNSHKMKDVVRRLYFLVKKYNLIKDSEYDLFVENVDKYENDLMSEKDFEQYLFGYNGFRNTIHNRIRDRLEDKDFIEIIGNPVMLNNIISAM